MNKTQVPNNTSLISVVVPVYNEEQVLREFCSRLASVFDQTEFRTEVVFVDDGSIDSSVSIMKEFQQSNSNVIIVCLSRNYGHQIALTAGLDHATGDAVITIDADLQDPPELILPMISEWGKGYDVVNTIREKRRGERRSKLITASVFYWLMRKIASCDVSLGVGDFRLLDRKVVDGLKRIKERHRYIRGLVSWVGYRHTSIKYKRERRGQGEPKYSLWKSTGFAIDAITTFSYLPLRLASLLGVFFALLSIGLSVYAIILKLFTEQIEIPGYAAIFVAITFLGGLQLIVLGILGEYLGRSFEEIRGRPLYYVKDLIHPPLSISTHRETQR